MLQLVDDIKLGKALPSLGSFLQDRKEKNTQKRKELKSLEKYLLYKEYYKKVETIIIEQEVGDASNSVEQISKDALAEQLKFANKSSFMFSSYEEEAINHREVELLQEKVNTTKNSIPDFKVIKPILVKKAEIQKKLVKAKQEYTEMLTKHQEDHSVDTAQNPVITKLYAETSLNPRKDHSTTSKAHSHEYMRQHFINKKTNELIRGQRFRAFAESTIPFISKKTKTKEILAKQAEEQLAIEGKVLPLSPPKAG